MKLNYKDMTKYSVKQRKHKLKTKQKFKNNIERTTQKNQEKIEEKTKYIYISILKVSPKNKKKQC